MGATLEHHEISRDYHAWCRAEAVRAALTLLTGNQFAMGRPPQPHRGVHEVLNLADQFYAYIDEGRTP